jgi:hypothetical protein
VHNLKAISATIASDDTAIVVIDDDQYIIRKVRGYTSGEASSTNDLLSSIAVALVGEIL